MWKDFHQNTQSFESRCVVGPENVPFAGTSEYFSPETLQAGAVKCRYSLWTVLTWVSSFWLCCLCLEEGTSFCLWFVLQGLNVWFISVLKWPCGISNFCLEMTLCECPDIIWPCVIYKFVLTCGPVWFMFVLTWHVALCDLCLSWHDMWPCVIYVYLSWHDMWPCVIYVCLSWHDMTLCDLCLFVLTWHDLVRLRGHYIQEKLTFSECLCRVSKYILPKTVRERQRKHNMIVTFPLFQSFVLLTSLSIDLFVDIKIMISFWIKCVMNPYCTHCQLFLKSIRQCFTTFLWPFI